MLPSLKKGGEGIAHSFNCLPRMVGLCFGNAQKCHSAALCVQDRVAINTKQM